MCHPSKQDFKRCCVHGPAQVSLAGSIHSAREVPVGFSRGALRKGYFNCEKGARLAKRVLELRKGCVKSSSFANKESTERRVWRSRVGAQRRPYEYPAYSKSLRTY